MVYEQTFITASFFVSLLGVGVGSNKESENLEVATRRLRKSLAPAGQIGLGLNSLAVSPYLSLSICLCLLSGAHSVAATIN